MYSVVRELPQVTDAKLVDFRRGRLHVRITYTYHHKVAVSPTVSSDWVDITDMISGKQTGWVLGGLVPAPPGASEETIRKSLDDADSGMLSMGELWRTRCGLELSVLTV